ARFFGAPVGLIMFTEQRMGPVQWMDLGIYLQSFMLRATEEGLATCPQGFWRRYDSVIKQHIEVPEGYLVAFGIALGYEDKTAPINTMRATRAEFSEWGQLKGF
ncbi:MAG: nitroreductase, partial [Comamonas sp.]|uniref:nitroreductase n=1 Tax=Comamonas sp. TaxID=34028 RepID=UPI00281EAB5D